MTARALCSACGKRTPFPYQDAIGFGPDGWLVNGDTYVCGVQCEAAFNDAAARAGERLMLFLPTLETLSIANYAGSLGVEQ